MKRKRPKIVCLCGSSRFVDIMAVCAWLIEKNEIAITTGLHLLPGWYSRDPIPDHLAEYEGCAPQMDDLHLRKIDLADEVFIVNYNDYVGTNTGKEIAYALGEKKKTRWFTKDPIGRETEKILNEFINRPEK